MILFPSLSYLQNFIFYLNNIYSIYKIYLHKNVKTEQKEAVKWIKMANALLLF